MRRKIDRTHDWHPSWPFFALSVIAWASAGAVLATPLGTETGARLSVALTLGAVALAGAVVCVMRAGARRMTTELAVHLTAGGVAALLLLLGPALPLVYAIAGYLFLSGVLRMDCAVGHPGDDGCGWLFAAGALSLALAVAVLVWPAALSGWMPVLGLATAQMISALCLLALWAKDRLLWLARERALPGT